MLTTFDTKEAFKTFSGQGFSEQQAEVLTDFLQKMHVISTGNLATKNDLKLTEASLEARIDRLQAEMKLMEQRMTIKLGGLLVIAVGIMTAIQQLLG